MTAGTLSTGIFREQSIDRLLELLPTQILVADHASGVKDMDRRVITHVSMSNDTPILAIPPTDRKDRRPVVPSPEQETQPGFVTAKSLKRLSGDDAYSVALEHGRAPREDFVSR